MFTTSRFERRSILLSDTKDAAARNRRSAATPKTATFVTLGTVQSHQGGLFLLLTISPHSDLASSARQKGSQAGGSRSRSEAFAGRRHRATDHGTGLGSHDQATKRGWLHSNICRSQNLPSSPVLLLSAFCLVLVQWARFASSSACCFRLRGSLSQKALGTSIEGGRESKAKGRRESKAKGR